MVAVCLAGFVGALSAGCNDIWNAGDLAEWVREQAVKSGCETATIELEDWYREEPGGNVWHGTCRDRSTGEDMAFAIGVDKVWEPSS